MASYIGVDVGKKSLHLYLPVIDQSFEFSNNQQGFHKLLNGINKHYTSLLDTIIVFEPTGGYERNLKEFLKFNKVSFATVHPNKVRSYAKAKGWLAKTDYIDAKLLSDYATVFSLPIKQSYGSKAYENLHSLMQRREQLILLKNQETNRLETRFNQFITESINDHIAHLDKQLKQIQIAIEEVCKSDIEIQNKVSRLTSIPGVGITVATNTICGAPELGNIEFKELTALVGLAPYARESGNYKAYYI